MLMDAIYKKYLTTMALIWTGCFVVFLFVYMLVLAPQHNQKERLEKHLAKQKKIYEVASKLTDKQNRDKLNEELDALKERLNQFVVNFEDAANLTFDIRQVAKENNTSAFTIRTRIAGLNQKKAKFEYIQQNQIELDFTSGFTEFATFLNALERHKPVVFVDRFSIVRSELSNSGHQVDMNLSVLVKKREREDERIGLAG